MELVPSLYAKCHESPYQVGCKLDLNSTVAGITDFSNPIVANSAH